MLDLRGVDLDARDGTSAKDDSGLGGCLCISLGSFWQGWSCISDIIVVAPAFAYAIACFFFPSLAKEPC